MIIELLLALLTGFTLGIVTGLTPGVHSNLITTLLISLFPTLTFLTPFVAAVFIVSLAITHTLIEFIPTIFLIVPNEDSFLALLPGQQLLAQGRAYEAVALLTIGSLLGFGITLLITPLYVVALPKAYALLTGVIPYILLALSLYLICREERPTTALLVFFLAALLGLLTFHLPLREPLLPLLAGLFGLSSMLTTSSIVKIPLQNTKVELKQIMPRRKEWASSLSAALLAAPLCSCLPGIGAGHAATLGSEIIPQNNRSFLLLVGALATAVMSLSFVTVYAIGRARSGAAAAIQEILEPFTLLQLSHVLILISIISCIAAASTLALARRATIILNKIKYRMLSRVVIIFLMFLTLIVSGPIGLLVLVTGAAIGMFCIQTLTRRINLMAALIVPAIIFYLTHYG